MTKKWFLVSVAAALVACMLLPAAALAAPAKLTAGIRGVSGDYVIHGTGSASIAGKLVYRRTTFVGHRRVKVDGPLNGRVSLFRLDESTGRLVKVASANTSHGAFRFSVTRGGLYSVRYTGTKSFTSAEARTMVSQDVLSVQNLGAVRTSLDRTGDLFVTLSADFIAPEGMLTTATPGAAIFVVMDGDGNPLGPLLGGAGLVNPVIPSDPLGGLTNGFLAVVRKSGTLRYGFSLPADQGDKVFTVMALFSAGDGFVTPASATATFTPNAMLPE
jgi:hypothetical protein